MLAAEAARSEEVEKLGQTGAAGKARRFENQGGVAELGRHFAFDHGGRLIGGTVEPQNCRVAGDIDRAAHRNRSAAGQRIDRQIELGRQSGDLGIARGREGAGQRAHDHDGAQPLHLLLAAAGAIKNRAVLDGEIVDGDFSTGARTGCRARARRAGRPVGVGRGRRELPIGLPVRQPLQQHYRVDEGDAGHLNLPAEQRDESDMHLQRFQARHVRGAAAGDIGQAHAGDGQGGRWQKRERHVAVDGEIAPGNVAHRLGDAPLVAVPVNEAGPDRHGEQEQNDQPQDADQEVFQHLSTCLISGVERLKLNRSAAALHT
jgi:hypothetical protein